MKQIFASKFSQRRAEIRPSTSCAERHQSGQMIRNFSPPYENSKTKFKILEIGIVALAVTFMLTGTSVHAQERNKLPRIGWLSAASSSAEFPEKQAFEELRAIRWVDGKNVTIDFRYAAGNLERLSQHASELVDLNVDVIVTFSAGVAIAKRATGTIPIVFGTSQDPVQAGFVASLARPGGNLTGVSFLTDELSGKRLELL